MTKPTKVMTSLRLTPEARTLLERLAEQQGISQAAVVELLVRQEAKKQDKRTETGR